MIGRGQFNRSLGVTLVTSAFSLLHNAAFAAGVSYAYSPQLVMTGASVVQQTYGDFGKGIVFGDIDTGITSQWVGFTSAYNGQGLNNINTSQSGTCLNTSNSLNGICSGALPVDGNGHGTFTASELVGAVPSAGYYSYAPAGSLVAVQVLSASGSGYSNDVANGIEYAVNHGAMVLNLSLGPSGTAAQQAAFYESIAGAVNYAASKGAYIVFAGGNASQAFSDGADISGFTNAAITHMLFMGSTNANEKLSSFSNTPGTGYFLSTTGQKYNYDSMWMMADGENIWGASDSNSGACKGYGCVTQMSGTSMAAPQGAGAIGLLLAEWPILGKNGTATAVLEDTGSNIGTNTTYGNGFLNLVSAFEPIGTLTVTTASGSSIALTSVSNSVLTGGALGSLSKISSTLSSYTTFDSFERNFTVNLSGLVATKPSSSAVLTSVTAPKSSVTSSHFADGSSLAFGTMDTSTPGSTTEGTTDNSNWFMSFTDAGGSTLAAGSGFPASASFASALWGNDNPAAAESSSLGVSNALLNFAQGGTFTAFGAPISKDTRLAMSWTQTQADNPMTQNDWTVPRANAFGAGMTTRMTQDWTLGLTLGSLNEQGGLLGTSYAVNGPINFGDQHNSMSFGISSAFDLGDKLNLLFDAAMVRTDGASMQNSLISSVSPVYARSMGATLAQHDALDTGDNVSLSLDAPLKVISGAAEMITNSVDNQGNPVAGSQRLGLAPNGNEMDLTLGYQAPLRNNFEWNVSFEARHDPDNIAGTSDVGMLVGSSLSF